MTATVRKKIYFLALGFFSLSLVFASGQKNDTNVMKINKGENGTTRMMAATIIQDNDETTERDMQEEDISAEENVTGITGNENAFEDSISANNINPSSNVLLNFPQNLQIVNEVLKKLKNANCVRDTTFVLEGMTGHERWALEMFDSFSKFPVGILYGNYYQLGNYDECIGVKHSATIDKRAKTTIYGQYCLADIHFKLKSDQPGRFARSIHEKIKPDRNKFNNTLIHWGICLPSSCATQDAEVFVQEIFSSVVANFEVVDVNVESNKCYYENSPPFSISEIIYGCIIGMFLMFTLFATGFHYWYLRQRKRYVTYNVDTLRTQSPKLLRELVICFSFINNIGKFLYVKPNDLNLECICGIKFLSMSLIIAGHTLIFVLGGPVINTRFFEETSTKAENSPLLNNALLVDTFLVVGGFLLCRLLLIQLDKRKGKVNIILLYIARYIRLTPSYIVMIGLYTTILYRTGSGPFWASKIGLERDRCLNSWWTNILYINNYVYTDQLCMFQSWYLAVDYHMFIISPFIVYPLWRNRRIGEVLLVFCTCISIGLPFWITYSDKLDPTLMAYPPEVMDLSKNFYFLNVYIKTHMRASSYFIGLLFGYLVHKLQSSGTKIKPGLIWMGWALAATLGILSMYSIVIFYNPHHTVTNFESATYASLHRVAWCLAIGWVLVACVTDNAAMVNSFLSWKFFIPASRLTYCAYLANGLVEIYNMGVLRQATYMSKYELACKVSGHLILTYGIAFIMCIFFESPLHGLEKLLLRKEKVKEQKQNSTLRPLEE